MIGLTDPEVYISTFNINTTNKNLKLYKFPDEKAGGFSHEKVRDEIERHLDISDITATNLRDEIIAPFIIKQYREQVTKRMKDDKYMLILAMFIDSMFQDFKSLLRTEIDLVEDDIKIGFG